MEVYELDGTGRLATLTLRGRLDAGGAVVAGFVLQGTARKRLLIRATGAAIGELGFGGGLADPVLTLYSGNNVVAANDRWSEQAGVPALEAAAARVGARPWNADTEDAAIFVTLPPGGYVAEVKGKGDAAGTVLLEIFELP